MEVLKKNCKRNEKEGKHCGKKVWCWVSCICVNNKVGLNNRKLEGGFFNNLFWSESDQDKQYQTKTFILEMNRLSKWSTFYLFLLWIPNDKYCYRHAHTDMWRTHTHFHFTFYFTLSKAEAMFIVYIQSMAREQKPTNTHVHINNRLQKHLHAAGANIVGGR